VSARCVLCWEGKTTVDGRVIANGALTWNDEPLPLLVHLLEGTGYAPSFPIGTVIEVQRHIDGSISGVLSHPIVGLAPEIDLGEVATELQMEPISGVQRMVFTSGRLRAVTLGIAPTWPGLQIVP
jgi:hypothetical protein